MNAPEAHESFWLEDMSHKGDTGRVTWRGGGRVVAERALCGASVRCPFRCVVYDDVFAVALLSLLMRLVVALLSVLMRLVVRSRSLVFADALGCALSPSCL